MCERFYSKGIQESQTREPTRKDFVSVRTGGSLFPSGVKTPVFLLASTVAVLAQQPIQPTGADGKPLNLGFESGTLEGWTATGTSFEKQPIKGDTVTARRADMKSEHAGQYWIGGFEIHQNDKATGTLTSATFKVTHPWASFLFAGGDTEKTRVDIMTKDDGKVIHTVHGDQTENLRRSVVDLRKFEGRDIFVRLVDEQTGHWGHLNFDDFVFHAAEPKFPKPAIAATPALVADTVAHAGLKPEQVPGAATVPAGYELKVFAAEPDIINPISFCLDDRGRAWVVEGITYPTRAKDGEGKDRVLVFEDTDGDHKFDKRTVFLDKQNLVSGIEVGHGGVWLGAAPYLYFVPVTDWDAPKPAGEPKVMLDGWGYNDTHETLNTFHWGPDGWLYGCHGVFVNSNVGKPGATAEQRTKINAGVWRFQPEQQKFEVFGHGTSNPWGMDWNEDGELIIEACVIPHLFHIFEGGRYNRQAGAHFNPYTYDDIKTIADHRHYLGANPHGGNGKSDAAGGGHAHAGLAVLQHPSWPKELRGGVIMGNIHGSRINMDILERSGSGYVAHHGADFINFNDAASQIVDIREDKDGSVWMIDWYDINQCHRTNREAHDYTTGRILKLVKKGSPATKAGERPAAANKVALADGDIAGGMKYAGPDGNAFQRRAAASLCQRLTVEQRKPIVLALLAHGEDKDDQNLPFMVWYAAEPIVSADPVWATDALAACKIPKVTEFIARRMASK